MAECDHQFVSSTVIKDGIARGIFGRTIIAAGLIGLFINPILGVLGVILGLIVRYTGRSRSVIVCAKCGISAFHQPE